jgi:uncharacterized membrane protein YccC
MSSSLLIGLEMAGVLGVVLLWGFWELYTLRRDNRRAAEAQAQAKVEAKARESGRESGQESAQKKAQETV